MTLGKRQLQSIAEILKEGRDEIDAAYRTKNSLTSKSRLTETLLFEEASIDNFEEDIATQIEGETYGEGQELVTRIDEIMYKMMADALPKYGAQRTSEMALRDEVEDFDADGLMEVQQELASDVAAAVTKYVKQVALMVNHVKLSHLDDEER